MSEPSQTPLVPLKAIPFCATLYSAFDVSARDELQLRVGDQVHVFDELPNDWYVGVANGKKGKFPRWKVYELDVVLAAAEAGNLAAQREMGSRYKWACGVEKSLAKAAMWYQRSAEQGDAIAQSCIGRCYEFGEGVKKDEARAVQWYKNSARQGDADAQFKLGRCYDDGCGTPVKVGRALKWWKRAAEQGHVHALYALGMYHMVRPDEDKQARMWFLQAAELGDARSQYLVSTLMDGADAEYWCWRAAEQKFTSARLTILARFPDWRLQKIP